MKHLQKFLAVLVLVVYAAMFWGSISRFWFHPGWFTDDALQQVYPFNRAIHPELFQNDFVTNLMARYLTPIHYWIGIGLTDLTQNPIMTAHWMMLIQLTLALVGAFLAIRSATCSDTAGLLGATWLLHSRPVIQRLSGGLVRGWALPLFFFYLWAACGKRYRTCLLILLIGCFLHPPATFLLGVTHGLWLFVESISQRKITRETIFAAIAAPMIAISAWYVTQMPSEIGTMITLEEAQNTPEMIRPHGRFAFVPLEPLMSEVRTFAFQAFVSRFYDKSDFARNIIPWIVIAALIALIVHDYSKRTLANERLVPTQVWCFGIALIIVYSLSRELAFKLYVPDRHLQLPCAVFFVTAFSCAISRMWHSKWNFAHRKAGFAVSALLTVQLLGAGLGLDGDLNFNRTRDQWGGLFSWAKEYTPIDSQFAGHPSIIDPMMLLGERAVYISFETSHPFYDRYLKETRVRLENSLRAHFSTSFKPLLALADLGNDYFVFDRKIFRNLAAATYGPPFGALVQELAAKSPQIFFYFRERAITDTELVPFADSRSLVVNLKVLRSRMPE